jgi:hypothetical protein
MHTNRHGAGWPLNAWSSKEAPRSLRRRAGGGRVSTYLGPTPFCIPSTSSLRSRQRPSSAPFFDFILPPSFRPLVKCPRSPCIAVDLLAPSRRRRAPLKVSKLVLVHYLANEVLRTAASQQGLDFILVLIFALTSNRCSSHIFLGSSGHATTPIPH